MRPLAVVASRAPAAISLVFMAISFPRPASHFTESFSGIMFANRCDDKIWVVMCQPAFVAKPTPALLEVVMAILFLGGAPDNTVGIVRAFQSTCAACGVCLIAAGAVLWM